MSDRKYNYDTQVYTPGNPTVIRVRNCNGFTCRNIGDTAVKVNGIILFPSATPATVAGDTVGIGGNADEIYVGKISIAFVQPVNALPQIEITQKFYIDAHE